MSAFARGQLEKYGWKEGKGLGKHEHGITTALKPKLKFDTHGVGHDPGKEFTNDWWNLAFNQAAKNITVVNSNDGVVVNSTVRPKKKKNRKSSANSYGSSFVKTATLLSNGEVEFEKSPAECEVANIIDAPRLTEEELISKCGGRTAHKAARHGFKLSGKLLRLEHQEAVLSKTVSTTGAKLVHNRTAMTLDTEFEPARKKRCYKNSNEQTNFVSVTTPDKLGDEVSIISKRIKKKKKKR